MHLRTIRLANVHQFRVIPKLSPEQLRQVCWIFDQVGWLLGDTTEIFRNSFLRHSDPDAEIAAWVRVVRAYHRFHGHAAATLQERVSALSVLLHLSVGKLPEGKPHAALLRLRSCFAAAEERQAVA